MRAHLVQIWTPLLVLAALVVACGDNREGAHVAPQIDVAACIGRFRLDDLALRESVIVTLTASNADPALRGTDAATVESVDRELALIFEEMAAQDFHLRIGADGRFQYLGAIQGPGGGETVGEYDGSWRRDGIALVLNFQADRGKTIDSPFERTLVCQRGVLWSTRPWILNEKVRFVLDSESR